MQQQTPLLWDDNIQMNRFVFCTRSISDKLAKAVRDPGTLWFYFKVYGLSRLRTDEPDIYMVSYPKSGRTWVRIMLKRYLELSGHRGVQLRDTSLFRLPGGKTLKFEHDRGNWVPVPCRLEGLRFKTEKYSGKKVIFLIRDPRDVLVSCWYHLKYREKIYKGGLPEFIRDDLLGIHKLVAFMNMWAENSNVPGSFYLTTYEDMSKNPITCFSRILAFIGLPVNEPAVKAMAEETSFSRMKKMEQEGSLDEPWMRLGAEGTEESMKIRRGKAGGYKDELSLKDIDFLDRVIHEKLSHVFPYAGTDA